MTTTQLTDAFTTAILTTDTLDADVRALASKAVADGDVATFRACDLALQGDAEAARLVARLLAR